MSHHRVKTTYKENSGYYGSEETLTLYADHNNSCDITTIYDGKGEVILCYENWMKDTLVDALNRLDAPFKENRELEDGVEYWTPEDYQRIVLNNK